MARPSKFAHVVYSTRRFEEMIDWYQRIFEAEVVGPFRLGAAKNLAGPQMGRSCITGLTIS